MSYVQIFATKSRYLSEPVKKPTGTDHTAVASSKDLAADKISEYLDDQWDDNDNVCRVINCCHETTQLDTR